MPRPRKGEEKEHYVSRCIREVVGEGLGEKAAQGKCYGMWESYHKAKEEDWPALEKAMGWSKPKKARAQKNPLGSVRMKDGKRYVKTEGGWKLLKSVIVLRKAPVAAATPRAGLAAKKVEVHRAGKTFLQTRHVREGGEQKKTPGGGLSTKHYGWVSKVAKVMGTGIPQHQAIRREDVLVLKKKLEDGARKGWRLSSGGSLFAWSENLGKIAATMEKSARLTVRVLRKGDGHGRDGR